MASGITPGSTPPRGRAGRSCPTRGPRGRSRSRCRPGARRRDHRPPERARHLVRCTRTTPPAPAQLVRPPRATAAGASAPGRPSRATAGASPSVGADPIQILTEYLALPPAADHGERAATSRGVARTTSGALTSPACWAPSGGVANSNLRYGQGGTGDPTTGREAQTPERVGPGRASSSPATYSSNWGQTDETRGLDYIANLFLRRDTAQRHRHPRLERPRAVLEGPGRGDRLRAHHPHRAGLGGPGRQGLLPPEHRRRRRQPPGQGRRRGTGAQGGQSGVEGAYASIIAMQQAQVAAQIAYSEWGMRSGDERAGDGKSPAGIHPEVPGGEAGVRQGVTEAGLTGQYNGTADPASPTAAVVARVPAAAVR